MAIKASYRRAGERAGEITWTGVIRDGSTVIADCGHAHTNRDVSTITGGKAATVCAREILDGARRPGTAEYIAEKIRTSWTRLTGNAGFTHPTGMIEQAKVESAQNAARYLAQVDTVRAALPTEPTEPTPVPAPERDPEPAGDIPDWML